MALLTPVYLDPDDVMTYLLNKLDVGTNEELQQVSPELLASWVRQGEVKVEQDLLTFYLIPFQTPNGDPFDELDGSTHDCLWNLLMTSAQIVVLEQQFGSSVNNSGETWYANLRREYKDFSNKFYMKASNGTYILGMEQTLAANPQASNSNGLIPPAEGWSNLCSSQMNYAARQINNPALTWYNARIGKRWR